MLNDASDRTFGRERIVQFVAVKCQDQYYLSISAMIGIKSMLCLAEDRAQQVGCKTQRNGDA
jgi:hypothetical protein